MQKYYIQPTPIICSLDNIFTFEVYFVIIMKVYQNIPNGGYFLLRTIFSRTLELDFRCVWKHHENISI